MQEDIKPSTNSDNEIDLIEVAKKIWSERKIIYKTIAVFFVLGLIIAFGTPKEYKAETTLLVETSSSSSMSGLLQQFGGLAGINLAGAKEGDNINPELYPNIVQSTPFLVEVLSQKVTYSKDSSNITVYNYLSNHVKPSVVGVVMAYTIGLPGKIIGLFKGNEKNNEILPKIDSIVCFTGQQQDIANTLKGRIKVTSEEGKISIAVEMPEPLAAAQLTNIVYQNLTKYLVSNKTQKASKDFEFISNQTNEAKFRFIAAQERLANFRDANRNIITSSFRMGEDRLQNEYTLAFNVYNGLAQQLEQAKIKVQEKTPVFKVLNPVQVPLEKSKPKRSLILIGMIFGGAIVGVGIVLVRFMLRMPANQ
jgi:uncharacterized protein involved in exopolysaccharide biosynthesis